MLVDVSLDCISSYDDNISQELNWKNVFTLRLLDICIAMSPLDLPVYILLWIVDWFEGWKIKFKEIDKVRLIEGRSRIDSQSASGANIDES